MEKKTSRLQFLLTKFTDNPNHPNDNQELDHDFKEIAQEIIFGGRFVITYRDDKLVKHTVKIRIVDVEAYYFNEYKNPGDPKSYNDYGDWIMYHRNHYKWDPQKQRFLEDEAKSAPYLPIGSFYLHTSGIDLTFEREKCFRASMLLRSYQLFDEHDNIIARNEKQVEQRPTYLYDDMFKALNPFCHDFKIEWEEKDFPNECHLGIGYRLNVAEYDSPENGKEPSKKKIPNIANINNVCKTKDYDYFQDRHLWRFYDADDQIKKTPYS